nr:hypothetical protein [Tanacetum cinerariifolium]
LSLKEGWKARDQSSSPRKRHRASSYSSTLDSPSSTTDVALADVFGPSTRHRRATTADDSPTPHRFVNPHPIRTPRDSEAYCRALSLACADILLPRKRISGFSTASSSKDSSEGSMKVGSEEEIDSDVMADIKADIAAEVTTAEEIRVKTKAGFEGDDEVESSSRGTIEIEVTRVVVLEMSADSFVPASNGGSKENFEIDIEEEHRAWEIRALADEKEGTRLRKRVIETMTITHSRMTPEAIEEMITRRVVEALAKQEANRTLGPIGESESENGDDNENGNGGGCRNRNGGRGNGGNGNGDQRGNAGRAGMAARECTYKEFLNCQPFNFKGAEGAFGLSRWFEKMESVFHISNCPPKYQVKYASCTLQNGALTWRPDVARAYTAKNNQKSGYAGSYPYCNKCRFHHAGLCIVKCTNCKKTGHMAMDCKNQAATTNQKGIGGHYRHDCPKLKNQNCGNQATNAEAQGRAFSIGEKENNKDSAVITCTFLVNNHYASMLFDSGADRSFVLTAFSSLMHVVLTTLDVNYSIELADGRVVESDILLIG